MTGLSTKQNTFYSSYMQQATVEALSRRVEIIKNNPAFYDEEEENEKRRQVEAMVSEWPMERLDKVFEQISNDGDKDEDVSNEDAEMSDDSNSDTEAGPSSTAKKVEDAFNNIDLDNLSSDEDEGDEEASDVSKHDLISHGVDQALHDDISDYESSEDENQTEQQKTPKPKAKKKTSPKKKPSSQKEDVSSDSDEDKDKDNKEFVPSCLNLGERNPTKLKQVYRRRPVRTVNLLKESNWERVKKARGSNDDAESIENVTDLDFKRHITIFKYKPSGTYHWFSIFKKVGNKWTKCSDGQFYEFNLKESAEFIKDLNVTKSDFDKINEKCNFREKKGYSIIPDNLWIQWALEKERTQNKQSKKTPTKKKSEKKSHTSVYTPQYDDESDFEDDTDIVSVVTMRKKKQKPTSKKGNKKRSGKEEEEIEENSKRTKKRKRSGRKEEDFEEDEDVVESPKRTRKNKKQGKTKRTNKKNKNKAKDKEEEHDKNKGDKDFFKRTKLSEMPKDTGKGEKKSPFVHAVEIVNHITDNNKEDVLRSFTKTMLDGYYPKECSKSYVKKHFPYLVALHYKFQLTEAEDDGE